MNENYDDNLNDDTVVASPLKSKLALDIGLIDISGSTGIKVNELTKLMIMLESMKNLFLRLGRSTANSVFRFAIIVFDTKTEYLLTSDGNKIFTASEGLDVLKNADLKPRGGTDIGKALITAHELSEEFFQSTGEPGKVSVFLMTDGKSNPEAAKKAAIELKAGINSPVLSTISYGMDANDSLLKEISSEASDEQKQVLRKAGLLNSLEDGKLFVKAHDENGVVTEEKIEIVRNFSLVISQTIAKD